MLPRTAFVACFTGLGCRRRYSPHRYSRRCQVFGSPTRGTAAKLRASASDLVPESSPSEPLLDGTAPADVRSSNPSIVRIVRNLWGFSRPHTVYGTICSVVSISLLAAFKAPKPHPFPVFLTALIPALLLNIFIVGLNQYYDIAIDRVNKPYLPLASGALTKSDAVFIILFSLIGGLLFCFAPLATPALRTVLIGSSVLGTVYSVPPFRLKRFALLASILILTVRGILVNLGFYLHSSTGSVLPSTIVFASAFFTFFGIVIALLKDVPDIRGDMIFGIRTFSVRLGTEKVFSCCVGLLVGMFLTASAFYYKMAQSTFGLVMAACHILVAAVLWHKSRQVSTEIPAQIYDFYMFSWKTFYMEYLLLPMIAI
ncbi:unnamed protein product [Agarophyton chilense]